MAEWIKFDLLPQVRKRKTPTWAVVTNDESTTLGYIGFYPKWRKFVYSPNGNTVYEETCLRDIAEFIAARTEEWRASKRMGKSREIAEDRQLQRLGMTVALPERLAQFDLSALMNEGPEGTVFSADAIASMQGQTAPLIDRTGPEPRVIGTATVVDGNGKGIARITDPSIRFAPEDGKRIEDKGD